MNPFLPPTMLPRIIRRYILFPLRFIVLWAGVALFFSAIPSCTTPEELPQGSSGE